MNLYTLENFKWGLSTQWSRLVALEVTHEESQKAYKVDVLVPLLDLLNTGYPQEINVECAMNEASTRAVCKTTKDVASGQEVRRRKESRDVLSRDHFVWLKPIALCSCCASMRRSCRITSP